VQRRIFKKQKGLIKGYGPSFLFFSPGATYQGETFSRPNLSVKLWGYGSRKKERQMPGKPDTKTILFG